MSVCFRSLLEERDVLSQVLNSFANCCLGLVKRESEVKTLVFWIHLELPGSGFSSCMVTIVQFAYCCHGLFDFILLWETTGNTGFPLKMIELARIMNVCNDS